LKSVQVEILKLYIISSEDKVKVKVTLRLAVYRQSVLLGVTSLEVHDQRFLFSAEYKSEALPVESTCSVSYRPFRLKVCHFRFSCDTTPL
jgi:hypothetical protein